MDMCNIFVRSLFIARGDGVLYVLGLQLITVLQANVRARQLLTGQSGRPRQGIQSIRGPEVSTRSPRVVTSRVQSPTPHARALQSVDTYQYRSPAMRGPPVQVSQVLDPELSGELQAPAHAVQATTRPQTYPGGSSRADLHPKKVSNLGPMAPRSRQKRQLPEGPQ